MKMPARLAARGGCSNLILRTSSSMSSRSCLSRSSLKARMRIACLIRSKVISCSSPIVSPFLSEMGGQILGPATHVGESSLGNPTTNEQAHLHPVSSWRVFDLCRGTRTPDCSSETLRGLNESPKLQVENRSEDRPTL
jgi:hypothetical protein